MKQAVLIKLTDVEGDVTAFIVNKDVAATLDQDNVCDTDYEDMVIERNLDKFWCTYAKTKDILAIVRAAEEAGYTVDLDEELDFVHF